MRPVSGLIPCLVKTLGRRKMKSKAIEIRNKPYVDF
jgi:hypothetical protein